MNGWTERLDQGISRPHRLMNWLSVAKKNGARLFILSGQIRSWSCSLYVGSGNLCSSPREVLHRFLGRGTHTFCIPLHFGLRLEQSGQLGLSTSALPHHPSLLVVFPACSMCGSGDLPMDIEEPMITVSLNPAGSAGSQLLVR